MREFDEEIARLGGRVAVISFASPEKLKRFARHLGHPFLWLADPGRGSYKRLSIGRRGPLAIAPPRVIWGYARLLLRGRRWRPAQLDWAQMGGDFVFDSRGNLTFTHVSSSSDDRPEPSALMEALRRAARGSNGPVPG